MMITKDLIFNPDTLNIFTDASIIKVNGETIGCAGCNIVTGTADNQIIIDQPRIVIRHSTNNNSEISAILLGVEYAQILREKFKTINIFSDSKICVLGLREWIFNWLRASQGEVLISSQKKPVANQDIILRIVYFILINNLRINLYHVNGHVNPNSIVLMDEAMSTFKTSNHINGDVEIELIKQLAINNDIVDRFTRDQLNSMDFRPVEKTQSFINYSYNKDLIDEYKYKDLICV